MNASKTARRLTPLATAVVLYGLIAGVLSAQTVLDIRATNRDWASYSTGVSIGSQTKVWDTVTITDSSSTSPRMGFQFHRQCMFRIKSGTITEISVYVASDPGTTASPATDVFELYDEDGTLIPVMTGLTTDRWYIVRDDFFPAGCLVFVAGSGESGVLAVCAKG